MLRTFAGVIALAAVLAAGIVILKKPREAAAAQVRRAAAKYHADGLLRRIDRYRAATWEWQALMGAPRTPFAGTAGVASSRTYRRWVLRLWQRRALHARRLAAHPPNEGAWLCIHSYEGSWNDPNAPYYGGLQMDIGFQSAYGGDLLRRKGTADRWTPIEQMWVAERARRSGRGFSPWPNTARACGLL